MSPLPRVRSAFFMVAQQLPKAPLALSLPPTATHRILPARTVKEAGLSFEPFKITPGLSECTPLTTTSKSPLVQLEPHCTTSFWYQRQGVAHDTTRRQFAPFRVTAEVPCVGPKLLP